MRELIILIGILLISCTQPSGELYVPSAPAEKIPASADEGAVEEVTVDNKKVEKPAVDKTEVQEVPEAKPLPETCVPTTEICGNRIDEDCNGYDIACPDVAVTISGPALGITDLNCNVLTVNDMGVCEGTAVIQKRTYTYITVKPSKQSLELWKEATLTITPQGPVDVRIKDWSERGKIPTSTTCIFSAEKQKCSLEIPADIDGLSRAEFSTAWKVELK